MNLGMLARVALLAALCTVGGTTVFAQLQSGRILGTVYDPAARGYPRGDRDRDESRDEHRQNRRHRF